MVEVPLANGRGVALVDDEDAERVLAHRWCFHKGGYAARRKDDRLLLMHREIVGLPPGDPRETDHINHNKLDNRRENLRIVTRAQNSQNTSARSRSTSRHRGVSFCRQTGRWRAVHELDGRYYHIGRYDTEETAALAAAAWRHAHMPYSTA